MAEDGSGSDDQIDEASDEGDSPKKTLKSDDEYGSEKEGYAMKDEGEDFSEDSSEVPIVDLSNYFTKE